jgi:hypothetical protein
LYDLCARLQSGVFNEHTDDILMCAFQLAFFGFLRCAEFTVRNSSGSSSPLVCIQDIKFHDKPASYIFYLKSSKTDPFGKGTSITIFSNKVLCPVLSMRKFILQRRNQGAYGASPLFLDYDHSVLTREKFVTYLRHLLSLTGLQESEFTAHSFRVGAATTAGSVGVEDHLIQTMGRWSSDCCTRHIRPSHISLNKAQQDMCSHQDF